MVRGAQRWFSDVSLGSEGQNVEFGDTTGTLWAYSFLWINEICWPVKTKDPLLAWGHWHLPSDLQGCTVALRKQTWKPARISITIRLPLSPGTGSLMVKWVFFNCQIENVFLGKKKKKLQVAPSSGSHVWFIWKCQKPPMLHFLEIESASVAAVAERPCTLQTFYRSILTTVGWRKMENNPLPRWPLLLYVTAAECSISFSWTFVTKALWRMRHYAIGQTY